MIKESTVLLSIRESGTPAARNYAFTILADGQVLDDRILTPVESQEISEISGQYRMLFDNDCRLKTTSDYLEILGSGLFHLFFESSWSQIKAKVSGGKIRIVISTDIPDVLNLPWEIARPPDGALLGFDQGLRILRLPNQLRALPQFEGPLPPGPLRVLFAASAPRQSFDYTVEEESFIKALEGLNVLWDSCDMGTFEELTKRADNFRPQIVHLVGQGVEKDGLNYFAFEGVNGVVDLRSAEDIQKAMPGVQLVILGGCQSKGSSILANLGIEMVRVGLPIVVSWTGSVLSSESVIRAFYRELASDGGLDIAMASMRREIEEAHKSGTAMLAFPFLFARTAQNMAFDPDQRASVLLKPLLLRQSPLSGTTEGYSENFVGRRRDIQRLVPSIGEGTARTIVITGPPGSGKSVLAVRLARELEAEGFLVVPMYSSAENPLSAARLLEISEGAFQRASVDNQNLGRKDLAEKLMTASRALSNPASSVNQRLEEAVEALNLGHFLLVLGEFDANLDESGRIKDPDVSQFYLMLLNNLTSSRAIITSRSLPKDAMTLPRKAWEHSLRKLTNLEFIRFQQRDRVAADPQRPEELTSQKLIEMYEQIVGSRCMGELARALREANFFEVAANSIPGKSSPQSFCDTVVAWLYGLLSSDSENALSKAAVYSLPINLMGLEAVTGETQERIRDLSEDWTNLALAFRTDGGLIAIRKELRNRLIERLDPEDLKRANEAAGDFLLEAVLGKSYRELGLTRLDCFLESRSHFLAASSDEKARTVTSMLSSILMARGLYGEVKRLNQELLDRAEHSGPIGWIAYAFLEQRDYENAQKWYQRFLRAPEITEKDAAGAWQGIAIADLRRERFDRAGEPFQKALEMFIRLGDEAGEAAALQGLTSVEMAKGNYESARERLHRILEIQRKTGDLGGQASALRDMIATDLRLKNHSSAREHLLESVEIFRKLSNPEGESAALYDLASLDLEKENFDSAIDEFKKALEIRRLTSDKAGEAAVLHSLAMIDSQKSDLQGAKEKFQVALKIYQTTGDKSGEAAAFFQLGVLAVQQSRTSEGMKLLALSGIILRTIGSHESRNVEPVVERMASQMKYTQDQFAEMVREAATAYRKDRGWGLVAEAFRN